MALHLRTERTRPFCKGTDILIIAALVLVSAVLWFWLSRGAAPGTEACVYRDGELVQTIPLHISGTVAATDNPAVNFLVQDGAVAFACSDCPDLLCVRTGFLRLSGQTAVCVPNRLTLRIENGAAPGPDAVAR